MSAEDLQYPIVVPSLVQRAKAAALALGFDLRPQGNAAGADPQTPSCCIDEVGQLLRTLTGSIRSGSVGEIGTGAGVGTAWMASGLAPDVQLYSVDIKPSLVQSAQALFADSRNVFIMEGDWQQAFVTDGPFELLFADGGGIGLAGPEQYDSIANLVVPGGFLVLDDLTPEHLWPDDWRGNPDPKRELAFHSDLFYASEVLSRPNISTLVMVRK